MRHYSLFNIFQGRATEGKYGRVMAKFWVTSKLQNSLHRLPAPTWVSFLANWTQICGLRFKNERLKNENTLIANVPWTLSSSFVEIFTRKRPELCKSLDRVKLGQGFMGSGPCLRHNAKRGARQIFTNHHGLLTEHTVEISQIFSDKNHPGLKTCQRSTCS